jgi:hypothetical protein
MAGGGTHDDVLARLDALGRSAAVGWSITTAAALVGMVASCVAVGILVCCREDEPKQTSRAQRLADEPDTLEMAGATQSAVSSRTRDDAMDMSI